MGVLVGGILSNNSSSGGGGGSGTVTSVSVVTANGFSGTVANSTTTPAITLTYNGTVPYLSKTTNYQILVADYYIRCPSGSPTFTYPDFTTIAAGKPYVIKNSGSGTVTWVTTGGQTIDGATTGTLSQYQAISILTDGTNAEITA